MASKYNIITKESLPEQIGDATTSLLKLARESCWNNISDNCRFILSEIKEDSSVKNFIELRGLRKTINDKKHPEPLDNILPRLLSIYANLHDINLYIYRSSKNLTIIEIAYYLKSSLEPDYQKTITNDPPMLHCKVAIPIYSTDSEFKFDYSAASKRKFDINWEHQTFFYHRWQIFWYRFKYRLSFKS
jgi:hypothetical protein